MKTIYKLCLGAGAGAAGFTPLITTVSCGCGQAKKEKPDVITPVPSPRPKPRPEDERPPAQYNESMVTNSINAFSARLKSEGVVANDVSAEALSEKLRTSIHNKEYVDKIKTVFIDNDKKLNLEETKGLLYLLLFNKHIKDGEKPSQSKIGKEIFDFVEKRAKLVFDGNIVNLAVNTQDYKVTSEGIQWSTPDLTDTLEFIGQLFILLPTDISGAEGKLIFGFIPGVEEITKKIGDIESLSSLVDIRILNNIGHLLKDLVNKGIGGLDFTSLKGKINEIDKIFGAVADDVKEQDLIFLVWNTLGVSKIIDEAEGIIKNGIFGISEETVELLNHLSTASSRMSIIANDAPKFSKVFSLAANIVSRAISPRGLSSVTKQELNDFIKELSNVGLITYNHKYITLLNKLLFDGWSAKEEFLNDIKSLIPASIIEAGVPGLGITFEKILDGLFGAMFDGNEITGTPLDIATVLSKKSAADISVAIKRGLFNLNEVEYKGAIDTVARLVSRADTIFKFIGMVFETKSEFREMIKFFNSFSWPAVHLFRDASYDLLFGDIRDSKNIVRRAINTFTSEYNKKYGKTDKSLSAILWMFANGLSNIPIEEGKSLANRIATSIAASGNVNIRSGNEKDFRWYELTIKFFEHLLIGKERLQAQAPTDPQPAGTTQRSEEIYLVKLDAA